MNFAVCLNCIEVEMPSKVLYFIFAGRTKTFGKTTFYIGGRWVYIPPNFWLQKRTKSGKG